MPHQRDSTALRRRRKERDLRIIRLQLVRVLQHAVPRPIMHGIPVALQTRHELRLPANIRLDTITEADRQSRIMPGSEMHDALARSRVGLLVDVSGDGGGVGQRVLRLDFELDDHDVQRAPQERTHIRTQLSEPFGDAAADELGVVFVRVGLDGAQRVGFERRGGGLAGFQLDRVHAEVDGVDAVVDADADFDGGGVEQAGGGAEIEGLRWCQRGISGGKGGGVFRGPTATAMPAQLASSSCPPIERFLSLPEIVQNPYGHSTAWGAIFHSKQ